MGARDPRPALEWLVCGGGALPPDIPSARARWEAAAADERHQAERQAQRLHALGVRVLARGDDDFPHEAERVEHVPGFLFVRGLPLPAAARAVAIVGARAATPYGVHVAETLARGLVRAGIAVVSGMARGIDAAAHRGALDAGGHTMAILPGGVDTVVPSHNEGLGERIAARGTLLSEFALGPPFGPGAFIRRNRLVAALTAATVVVEAGERSGALSTAAIARTLGRSCLAVPGDVDRPQSRGCLALLRGGARVCADVADILDCPGVGQRGVPGEGDDAARVAACLRERPLSPDRLARECGLSIGRTLKALGQLELAGLARVEPGQRYVKAAGRPR